MTDFYIKNNDGSITCLLCKHYCKIKEGKVGACGVNMNRDGKLHNLVYGNLAALHVDPIEKKPLYHFLPGTTALSLGTVGCNMKCPFCQNWQISQTNNIKNSTRVTPQELVNAALRYKSSTIAYTYNEPTIFYPFARDVAMLAKEYGLKNIFVTNGIMSDEVIDDMTGLIDACNVDYKSNNEEYYKKVLKAPFVVKENLVKLKKAGIWVEVTTLVVPGVNDSRKELSEMAKFIANNLGEETPWHVNAFHPDYKMTDTPPTSPVQLLVAEEEAHKVGLKYVYVGNLGLENVTYCPKCGAELIKRHGYYIVSNILQNGHCPYCKTKIQGVWE
jgi:pyruvate formate lyase activating enzyme